ncbi:Gfo/Idh/MocA family protein [Maritimibacter fusiformis]|uniref:Gfo/Idh/MocA family oxidoreductase n=1 Tax=Maritimibacter fusiformis TaxID=2603819 RepID=A0A5D0RPM4_9RHOB|nr:Gfo/Idh/MocA family oxidoreductase [Maritimibacter fusiformis]TYB82946.1 Gfo/Idh/MocA family oxidoreductase [Maritimibacter fusiformis]
MAEAFRWGILGAAKFAAEHMGPAINAAPDNRLVALATSTAEKAAPFEAVCPGLDVFLDYDAMLEWDAIDAVYIPLPNHMHVDWTKKAARAGKHVLTEKPIALNAGEIDELIALRDETGLLIAEAYMIVHHPQWLRVRELIQSGEIGKVDHVDAAFSYDNRADPGNFRNRPDAGGGGIRDVGVYTYSSVRFATGAEPVDLSARLKRENGVDTWAQVLGEMEGPLGRFTYSAMTSMRLSLRQEVVFQGERGTITLRAPFNPGTFGEAQVEIRSPDGTIRIERWPRVNQYVEQVRNFARSAREGAPYPCPLEFSRGTQAMIDTVFDVAVEIG